MRILTDLDQLQLDRIEAKLDKLLAKKKPKPRASKGVVYWDFFEAVWSDYPKRAGNNPKNKAFAAFKSRSHESNDKDINMTMAMGVNRYALYCDAMGLTGTEKVMHGSTFFGPSDPPNYTLDWTIPKQKVKNGQPEIFSQSHQDADFSGQAEKALDPVDPYAELKS